MTQVLTKRQKIARAAEYARTVEKVDVLHADLKPGMVIIRPDGARRRIVSVGEDVRGMFASRVKFWEARGIEVGLGMCYQTERIDEFGLPDAAMEREVEAKTGPVLNICPPDVALVPLQVEKDSIPE